jgi:glutaredoxin-like protein NrdH
MTIVAFVKPKDFIPKCQPCVATVRKLEDLDLEHEQRDATDPDNLALIKDHLGHYEAPVIVVFDGDEIVKHWSGYRPDLIDELAKEVAS